MRFDANTRTWNILGLLLFVGMIVSIFWEVLPWFLAPVAPDAMPFFSFGYRTVTLDNLLAAGGEATPQHLYWLIFHPLLANKLTYIVDTLLLALAGVYYLRGRGAGYPAAWIGGLALGFSGYTFTLFSAGHRGYFHMMACAVFSFGLLLRCFHGRRWFHFAMLGACVAWGVPYQADVLVMVLALAGAYALWLTFARGSDARTPWQRVVHVYPRFLISLAVAVTIAWPGLQDVLGRQINIRKEQLSSVSSSAADTTAVSPAEQAAKKRDQWIFATNWSLPPADIAEFIVPGIYGNDSMQLPYPYWGALGRPYGWAPGQRMMPNYRQHTLYLGVLPVCFAMFAVLLWWRTRTSEMTISQALFSFKGRMSRSDFWLKGSLPLLPLWIIAGIFADNKIVLGIILVVLLWPTVAVAAKRIHDHNRSAWLLALALIPFVNIVFVIWVSIENWFLMGTVGSNRYGKNPFECLSDGRNSTEKPSCDPLADVPFWLGAGLVCLLLALGRYTPFYRLFYVLPYMDLIRCPVKIHHLVEICTAFLCGLGVEMWWRGAVVAAPAKRGGIAELPPLVIISRHLTLWAAIATGVLLLAAVIVTAAGAGIAEHIGQLGLGGYGEKLVGYTAENLVRASCLFGGAAMLFWFGRPRVEHNRPATWLLIVLALVLAVDLSSVARRFMRPLNLRPYYAQNIVTEAVLSRNGIGSGVANYAMVSRVAGQDWFSSTFHRNGLRMTLPAGDEEDTTLRKVAKVFEKRPDILWRVTHARVVIAPWPALESLVRDHVVTPLLTFALDPQSAAVHVAQPAKDTVLLAETTGGLPDAYVVDAWQGGLNEAGQLAAMATAAWDPSVTTVSDASFTVASGTNGVSRLIGQALVTCRRGSDFHLITTVDVTAQQSGLLVVNEGYADDLTARVDGHPAALHRANALWCAIETPAGKHIVTIGRQVHAGPVLVSAWAGAVVILWGLLRLLRRKRRE